ncbi:hypothetical protein ACRFBT_26505 [Pseudomonas aeruginosa]|uniref:hypothetical protein n=1 Tax=Pseudomonas aeruginosa TaxID=287 RepID=UPI003D6FAF34
MRSVLTPWAHPGGPSLGVQTKDANGNMRDMLDILKDINKDRRHGQRAARCNLQGHRWCRTGDQLRHPDARRRGAAEFQTMRESPGTTPRARPGFRPTGWTRTQGRHDTAARRPWKTFRSSCSTRTAPGCANAPADLSHLLHNARASS